MKKKVVVGRVGGMEKEADRVGEGDKGAVGNWGLDRGKGLADKGIWRIAGP